MARASQTRAPRTPVSQGRKATSSRRSSSSSTGSYRSDVTVSRRRSSGATESTIDLNRRSSTGSSRRSSVSSDTTSGQSCRRAQCVARAKTTGVRCKHCVNPAIQNLGKVSNRRNSLPVKVATAYSYVAKPHNEYGICYQHVAKSLAEHREPRGTREARQLINDPRRIRDGRQRVEQMRARGETVRNW